MTLILYIDDELTLLEIVSEELEDAGYAVIKANDGNEGLAQIVEHGPDLVLCDIALPNKNGYELLRDIRKKYPLFDHMPFIFLTALADRERVIAGLREGADAYLTKPIDFEILLATIEASLRQTERVATNDRDFKLLDS